MINKNNKCEINFQYYRDFLFKNLDIRKILLVWKNIILKNNMIS